MYPKKPCDQGFLSFFFLSVYYLPLSIGGDPNADGRQIRFFVNYFMFIVKK